MKKRSVLTGLFVLFFYFILFSIQAQTHAEQNLQKYWTYRERLKNYMINGTNQGNSIPAQARVSYKQVISWNDSPWETSYWMGTLAMEYDLLVRANAPAALVSQTLNDLYNVIEAANRLDFNAEGFWKAGSESLNGFSVPDDIPVNFKNRPNADALNDCWVPPPDWYRAKCMDGSPEEYVIEREVSVDHVAGMFIGLSLVKKLIPASLTVNNGKSFADYSTDNPTNSYVVEVQNIANRYINWMQSSFPHQWKLQNLIENRCVLGVCNEMTAHPCQGDPIFDEPWKTPQDHCKGEHLCLIGNTSGSYAKNGALGFLAANVYMQEKSASAGLAFTGACQNAVLRDEWDAEMVFTKLQQRWPVTLAAIGGIWEIVDIGLSGPVGIDIILGSTRKNLAKHLVHSGAINNWEHLILLNRLLYGTHKHIIPNDFYECLLDNAPCRGFESVTLTGHNAEWEMGRRLMGDRGAVDDGIGNSGLSYLFYFNLYNEVIYNDNETSSEYYNIFKPISIHDLALENVDKKDYIELDKKNFMASNSITAHESYVIDNYGFEDQGRVTFVAGNYIDLLPGFAIFNSNNVLSGATLNSYIDPTIKAMTCYIPAPSDAEVGCAYLETNLKESQDTMEEFDTLFVVHGYPNNSDDSDEVIQNSPEKFSIAIVPNPSTGLFTMRCKNPIQNIEMRDVLGSLVYSKTVNNISANMEIDISKQPRGIYFLKAQSGDNVYTEKVVVQ